MTASMLRDIERGGPIEADHIIGDLLRRGGNPNVIIPSVTPVVGPEIGAGGWEHGTSFRLRLQQSRAWWVLFGRLIAGYLSYICASVNPCGIRLRAPKAINYSRCG
jgi:hypothetical protein